MTMNEHPQASIPAFVLGTLDIDEALLVHAHVVQCPDCRAEVETFQTVLSTLPYAATPRQPPPHVKQQLLARIAALPPARPATLPARPRSRWMQAVAGGAMALALVLAMRMYDMNSRLSAIDAQLVTSRQ